VDLALAILGSAVGDIYLFIPPGQAVDGVSGSSNVDRSPMRSATSGLVTGTLPVSRNETECWELN
jgi:hypothetical protein